MSHLDAYNNNRCACLPAESFMDFLPENIRLYGERRKKRIPAVERTATVRHVLWVPDVPSGTPGKKLLFKRVGGHSHHCRPACPNFHPSEAPWPNAGQKGWELRP